MLRRRFLLASPGLVPMCAGRARAEDLRTIRLEAADGWTTAGGRAAYLSTFNGQSPGPAIEARPGDTLRIELHNSLPEPVNLHFHGLHVPPTGNADNSFLHVPPGESFNYELNIPAKHPSGMFWYHPHIHGLAARQVSRGLAGLIFIRGEFDGQPGIRDTPEFPLVFQDFDLDAGGQPVEPGTMERNQGREGPLITVNGEVNPTIPITAGGWVRARLLNASASRFYRLRLEEHSFIVAGTDGGLVSAPWETEEILLVPGQRYDLFIRGRAAEGRFRLLNLPYNRLGNGMGMGMGGRRTTAQPAAVLATVEYAGVADTTMTLPSRLGSIEALDAAENRRTLTFGMGMGMFGSGFSINGRRFDPERVDIRATLGSTEEWELINPSDMDHPFHIHTNPFQVVTVAGEAEDALRDVLLVPARSRARIRIAFRDYPGKALYHCHILDHEDLGMMGVIEIAG